MRACVRACERACVCLVPTDSTRTREPLSGAFIEKYSKKKRKETQKKIKKYTNKATQTEREAKRKRKENRRRRRDKKIRTRNPKRTKRRTKNRRKRFQYVSVNLSKRFKPSVAATPSTPAGAPHSPKVLGVRRGVRGRGLGLHHGLAQLAQPRFHLGQDIRVAILDVVSLFRVLCSIIETN